MSIMLSVLIIVAIIIFCVSVISGYRKNDGLIFLTIEDVVLAEAVFALVSLIIIIVAMMIPIGPITTDDSLESTIELIALNDKTLLEGAMYEGIFVTSGYIDTLPIYAYYYKAENESVKFGKILADSTSIYYIQDDSSPRIETYHRIERGNTLYNFPTKYEFIEVYYKLYIPKNSISPDIRLDLES